MKLKDHFYGVCEEMAYLAGEIEQIYYSMVHQPDYTPEVFLDVVGDRLQQIMETYQSLLPVGGVHILGNDIFCKLCGREIADVIAQTGNL